MKTIKKFSGKDFILLLLYSPGVYEQVGEPIVGRTRLTKSVFLFKEEFWQQFKFSELIDRLQEFFAWNYGPFSTAVFSDIEFFKKIGFIEGTNNLAGDVDAYSVESLEEYEFWLESCNDGDEAEFSEFREEVFRLSPNGMKFVEKHQLYSSLTDVQLQTLREFKNKINSMSLKSLLQYVYTKYPEYTEKSLIKEQFTA